MRVRPENRVLKLDARRGAGNSTDSLTEIQTHSHELTHSVPLGSRDIVEFVCSLVLEVLVFFILSIHCRLGMEPFMTL